MFTRSLRTVLGGFLFFLFLMLPIATAVNAIVPDRSFMQRFFDNEVSLPFDVTINYRTIYLWFAIITTFFAVILVLSGLLPAVLGMFLTPTSLLFIFLVVIPMVLILFGIL